MQLANTGDHQYSGPSQRSKVGFGSLSPDEFSDLLVQQCLQWTRTGRGPTPLERRCLELCQTFIPQNNEQSVSIPKLSPSSSVEQSPDRVRNRASVSKDSLVNDRVLDGRIKRNHSKKSVGPWRSNITSRGRLISASTSTLNEAAKLSNTTINRCIERMSEAQLLEAKRKPHDPKKPFSCLSGCGKTFTRPLGFKRNENTNRPTEGWVCDLDREWTDTEGRQRCAFCSDVEPDDDHFKQRHNNKPSCSNKPLTLDGGKSTRIFFREDKLLSHFRTVHKGVPLAIYRGRGHFTSPNNFDPQCGFCGKLFQSSDERLKHIIKQFRKGRRMSQWNLPWQGRSSDFEPCVDDDEEYHEDEDDNNDGNDDPGSDAAEDGGAFDFDGNDQSGGSSHGFESSDFDSAMGGSFGSGDFDFSSFMKSHQVSSLESVPKTRIQAIEDLCVVSRFLLGPEDDPIVSKYRSNSDDSSSVFWLTESPKQLVHERIASPRILVKRILGVGAHSQVDEIVFKDRKRRYARKTESILSLSNQGSMDRFLKELTITAWARHPHIVGLHGLLVNNLSYSLLMDPVGDFTLRQLLLTDSDDRTATFCDTFFGCIARGVHYLHSAGIIHGDLKPENILCHAGERFLICDFGSASVTPDTRPREFTPKYAAPEIKSGGYLQLASDVWSLGVIFVEVMAWLSGRHDIFKISDLISQDSAWVDLLNLASDVEQGKMEKRWKKLLKRQPWAPSVFQGTLLRKMLHQKLEHRASIGDLPLAFPSGPCCSLRDLSLRLWTFQETLLSPRNLRFNKGFPSRFGIETHYRFEVRNNFNFLRNDEVAKLALAGTPPYQPLEPRQIRLLQLDSDHDKFLRGRLTCVSLDDAPPYCAISYCWGKIDEPRKILVNGQNKQVTRNLDNALRAVKNSHIRNCYLWVDAICIDQSDRKERTHQVGLMREIFQAATDVVAYLGETSLANSSLSFEASEAAILDLAQQPWFHRVWICQELTVAQNMRVIVDKQVISWSQFYDTCRSIFKSVFKRMASSIRNSSMWKLRSALEMLMAIEAVANHVKGMKELSMLDLLKFFRRYETTDPRDKVYALLAFRTEVDQWGLSIDYSLSAVELYIDTARKCLMNGQIDILSSCHGESPLSSALPSWVPDWSSTTYQSVNLPSFTAGKWENSLDWAPQFICIEQPKFSALKKVLDILIVHGVAVDQVVDVFSDFKHITNEDFASLSIDLKQKPQLEARYAERVAEAIWKTSIADREPQESHGWKRSTTEILVDFPWQENNETLRTWWTTFELLRESRTMFCTSNGYLGLGPDGIASGDLVVILLGASVPLVLRQQEGAVHEVVGDAYVHGIMDGEFMDSCPPIQQFSLV